MANHHSNMLSDSQMALLHLLLMADEAEPGENAFTCKRMQRIAYTWIVHAGFYHEVRVASWDDVTALDRYGLIELRLTDDDAEDSSFVLAPHARETYDQLRATSVTREVTTSTVDHGMAGHS